MLVVVPEVAMHPEADALLDAIFDAPDDDTPRLVYADWLQEHGHEQYAEFIRLSVAIARQVLPQEERSRLRRRRHLLGQELLKDSPIASAVVSSSHVAHGPPSAHYGSEAAAFLANSKNWWPFIVPRSLSLCGLFGREREVASCDYLRRLVALSCAGTSGWFFYEHRDEVDWRPISGDLLSALAMRTDLDRLRTISIEPIAASVSDLLTFARSPLVIQLEQLRLWVEFPDGTREDLHGEKGVAGECIRDFVARHSARFAVPPV